MSIDEDNRHDPPRAEDRLEIGAEGDRPPPRWLSWTQAYLHGRTRVVAVIAAAVLLAVGGGIAIATRSSGDSDLTAAKAQVLALEQREQRDAVNADTRDLAEILSPGFQLVAPDGSRLTRENYLSALASGDLNFKVFVPTAPMHVRTDGQQAVVTFPSRLDVSSGPLHLKHQAWHTVIFEKTQGRWQAVWAQTTAIGGFPPRSP